MKTPSSAARFLIVQTAFLGDVVLATALLESVHATFPNAQIDVLLRKGNESLLAGHPFLREVLIWDKKASKYRDWLRLLRSVWANRYDVVFCLQRFGAMGLLTALSGARVTVGFDKNPFARGFTHRVPHRIEPGVHEVERNAALLGAVAVGVHANPKLYPQPADVAAIVTYQTQPYVCIAPTSVWFTKQYPGEKWADLLRELPERYVVYLLGAPGDVAACDEIQRSAGRSNVVNLAGKLNLLQSAALMGGAAMNYVNDSAPMHLASAMNAPTTAVFCSTVPDFGFGPLADERYVVETPELLACRPCGLHGRPACPLGHFRCAHSIQTAQLLAGLP